MVTFHVGGENVTFAGILTSLYLLIIRPSAYCHHLNVIIAYRSEKMSYPNYSYCLFFLSFNTIAMRLSHRKLVYLLYYCPHVLLPHSRLYYGKRFFLNFSWKSWFANQNAWTSVHESIMLGFGEWKMGPDVVLPNVMWTSGRGQEVPWSKKIE